MTDGQNIKHLWKKNRGHVFYVVQDREELDGTRARQWLCGI